MKKNPLDAMFRFWANYHTSFREIREKAWPKREHVEFSEERSIQVAGEYCTPWEKRWIEMMSKCPDCEKGVLERGPCGGATCNYTCKGCHNKFNIALVNGQVVYAQRI